MLARFLPPPGCSGHACLARVWGSPPPARCWLAAHTMGKRGASKAPRIESHGPRNRPWEPPSRTDGLAGSSASGTAVPRAPSRVGVAAAARGQGRHREVGLAGGADNGVGGGTGVVSAAALAPRSDMTTVRNVRRADTSRAWNLASTAAGRAAMLQRFDRDVHTHRGHGVRDAQLHSWEPLRICTPFCFEFPALPALLARVD